MDDDNNAGALKSVRDEVAAMLDARERWYLVNSRFRVEAWVTQDDSFWTDVLEFWRAELGKKLKPSTKPGA